MKSISILIASLLAVASASPLNKRIDAQEFQVSEFEASCIRHGTGCTIKFNVQTNQIPYHQTKCMATVANAVAVLPDVPFTACEDPAIMWSFRTAGATPASFYELTMVAAEQKLAAAKMWSAAMFPVYDDGSSSHQEFNAESTFVVSRQ